MSTGGATVGSAGVLDVGPAGSPADNTFDPTTTSAGTGVPADGDDPGYFPGYWTYTPAAAGFLTLNTEATEGGAGLPDTVLYVLDGSTIVAQDDDSGIGRTSSLGIDVAGGTTYTIEVAAFDSDGGDLTLYHLAATFTEVPVLPNPREFTVPGGTQTAPGLVMGPGVIDAPVMPPLSVSRSTDGTLPDATYVFDATSELAALGVPAAWVTFDATLSYLTDGTCDTTAPEVGLNIFTVAHGLPFTWEEPWDTLEIGQTDGTDDYGRPVPRGQWTQLVTSGTTYIIQLTTPPGNAVRFILRVSAFGQTTSLQTLPDQAWRVTTEGYSGGGSPVTYGPQTIPWARASSPDGLFGARDTDATFPAWDLLGSFAGHKSILQTAGGESPATSMDAITCAWTHARRGDGGLSFWSADGTGSGPPPGTCQPLADHESGGLRSDGGVGYDYESENVLGSGHRVAWDVYGSQHRLRTAGILEFFGPTAGFDPDDLTPPAGFTSTSPLWTGTNTTNPGSDTPDLIGVDIAQDQLDGGATDVPVRMYASAVTYDNTDGSSDPWGPAEDDSTDNWRGTTDGPEAYDTAHPVQFTDPTWLDITSVWEQALADEAAYAADPPDDGFTYNGGLSVVGLFDSMLGDGLPSPAPAGTLGETLSEVSTYTYPVARMRLRPTGQFWWADPSVVPPATPFGDVLRLEPRDDALGAATTLRVDGPLKATRVSGGYPG